MAHLEQEEITSSYERPMGGRPGLSQLSQLSRSSRSSRSSLERLRRRERVACITWQSARLFLLAWSLLCFYCSLRLCLNSHTIDFSAVSFNLLTGLWAWWLVCRTSALPMRGGRLNR